MSYPGAPRDDSLIEGVRAWFKNWRSSTAKGAPASSLGSPTTRSSPAATSSTTTFVQLTSCPHPHRIPVRFPDTDWVELCPSCQREQSVSSAARRSKGGSPLAKSESTPTEALSPLDTAPVPTAESGQNGPGTTRSRGASTQVPQGTTRKASSPRAGNATAKGKRATSPPGRSSRKKPRRSSRSG